MKTRTFGRYAFSCVAAAIVTGCGGNLGSNTVLPIDNAGHPLSHHHTFNYTGGSQIFKVPAAVKSIVVVARGAAGGGEKCYSSCYGKTYFGRGGRVYAVIPVTPGERLYVFVGGAGGQGPRSAGGFNGGGNGGTYSEAGYGGGGASDVRRGGETLRDRILVAAGGGGQGAASRFAVGGSGGGKVGGSGGSDNYSSYEYNGGGGTGGAQSEGGSGGTGGVGSDPSKDGYPGDPGAFGFGGSGGGAGSNPSSYGGSGGGGGGGYYGGGGGGGGGAAFASIYGGAGGGGGGGSAYIEPNSPKFQTWAGWKTATGNGLVVFSW